MIRGALIETRDTIVSIVYQMAYSVLLSDGKTPIHANTISRFLLFTPLSSNVFESAMRQSSPDGVSLLSTLRPRSTELSRMRAFSIPRK